MSAQPVVTSDHVGFGSAQISLALIVPSPTNPRRNFEKGPLEELALSIKRHGILQPVLLRPWPAGLKAPKEYSAKGAYELVAGERRLRAAKTAGLLEVPALVRLLDDNEVLEIQLIENLQRSDLHPLEEAQGFRQLIAAGHNLAHLAERIGRSTTYIYDRAKLLALVKEAQELFLEDRFTAGHAILLSRLTPADQRRALDRVKGGVFTGEALLFDPRDTKAEHAVKPKSVRELQAWIDEHVKFDVEAPDLPDLYPLAHVELQRAQETAEKVIKITLDHFVQPDARDGERVVGPRSWKEVKRSKPCEYSVTGVIVIGPGRGETLRVCVEKKKCAVHWGGEMKEAKKRETAALKSGGKADAEELYKRQQQRQEEERKLADEARARWKKAAPAILKAVAAAVTAAPAKSGGPLGDILVKSCLDWRGQVPAGAGHVPRGKTAEDLVRHAVFLVLAREVMDDWGAPKEFPKRAKLLGLDVAKVLDQAAPVAKTGEPTKPKKAKGR